jgi:uncharacterized protein
MMNGDSLRMPAARREVAWFAATLTLVLCAGSGIALGADSLTLITQAAESGADASQVLLAVAYLNGDRMLARDPYKAAYWFEQAAIRGNAYAQSRLGELYEQGLGVPRNKTLAFDWRIKAAERGELEAQLDVARMYQEGTGVGKDIDEAICWYRRAATEGSAEARFRLERLFRYGSDVEVARASDRSFFEKAALRSHESVIYVLQMVENIGYMIEEGWHHRVPDLKKLASDGDLEAEYQLAQRYELGSGGVRKDIVAAIAWYGRAAAGGHPMAALAMARVNSGSADGAVRGLEAGAQREARAEAPAR